MVNIPFRVFGRWENISKHSKTGGISYEQKTYLHYVLSGYGRVSSCRGTGLCSAAMAGSLLAAAPVFAESQTETSTEASGSAPTAEELLAEKVTPDKAYKFALITMDSIDQHWVNMNNGAQEEAKADGVTVDFMSPDTKDDAKQIEMVNNATAAGYDAIMIAANGPDAITGALKDAQAAGIKIVYVDSPANLDAEATFSTDNKAAGKTAGEQMIAGLKDKGITKGDIGIVNVNASTQTAVDREQGFRDAFNGTDFNILETQYCDGDASKAQSEAENYITQGVVGIYGTNEGSSTGVGNAIKASGNADLIGVGFDKSDTIKGLITDGYLACTMAQNPDVMGKLGVKACIKVMNGENLGGVTVDTGVTVLTKDNVNG